MGVNTLIERGIEVITSNWVNDLRTAMLLDWVPRNANGVPEDYAGNLGTEDYRWNNIRAKTLFLDDSPVESGLIQGRSYKVTEGKTKAESGFPDYLTPAGSGNGLSATLDASTTFKALINNVSVEIASNVLFPSLTAAIAANNTADINEVGISSTDDVLTRGEIGNKPIPLDNVTSGWEARDGEIHPVLTPGGEVMLGTISAPGGGSGSFTPILRGFGGTGRASLADNDQLTLLKLNTLLLKSDGTTVTSSDEIPQSVTVAPGLGSTGSIYFERSTRDQKYDDGSEVSGDWIVIGYAICDDADCLWVEHVDFDLSWADILSLSFHQVDNGNLVVRRGSYASISGKYIEFPFDLTVNTTTDLDSGQVLTANKELYIYLKEDGSITVSHIVPRLFDFYKRGRFHPFQYYRMVGSIQLDASTNLYGKRKEVQSKEQISDSLVPVGTILPINPGYFGDGSNGSYADSIGSTVALVNDRIGPNWKVCDGSAIDDPESPLFNGSSRFLPNLTDTRFLLGDTTPGTAGGSNTKNIAISNLPSHAHDMSHTHTGTFASSSHTHDQGGLFAALIIRDTGETPGDIIETLDVSGLSSYNINAAYDFTDSGAGAVDINESSSSLSRDRGIDVRGDTGTPSGTSSVGSFSGNTSSVGSGTALDILPKYLSNIYIMRVK